MFIDAQRPRTKRNAVIQPCNECSRSGQLVCQSAEPGSKQGHPSMHYGPWVFRHYLCRWHRAAWNRRRFHGQKRMDVVEYIPDATLLANEKVSA